MATTEKLALIDNSGVSTTDLLINTGTPTFEGKAEPQTSVELFDNDDSGGSTSLGTTSTTSIQAAVPLRVPARRERHRRRHAHLQIFHSTSLGREKLW